MNFVSMELILGITGSITKFSIRVCLVFHDRLTHQFLIELKFEICVSFCNLTAHAIVVHGYFDSPDAVYFRHLSFDFHDV